MQDNEKKQARKFKIKIKMHYSKVLYVFLALNS